ncbi:MAG: hypothetical protein Q9M92_07655 [Enterobacterales bacterium]|nr:hypothetical protein [Enterobacterales bacterium]
MSDANRRSSESALDPSQQAVVNWLKYTIPLNKMPPKLARWMFLLLEGLIGLKKQPVARVQNYFVNSRHGSIVIRGYYP